MGVGACSTVVGAAVITLSTTRVTSTVSRITSAVGFGAHATRTRAATRNSSATEVAILLVCCMLSSFRLVPSDFGPDGVALTDGFPDWFDQPVLPTAHQLGQSSQEGLQGVQEPGHDGVYQTGFEPLALFFGKPIMTQGGQQFGVGDTIQTKPSLSPPVLYSRNCKKARREVARWCKWSKGRMVEGVSKPSRTV